MDITPFDRYLMQALLEGKSSVRIAEILGLPLHELDVRLKRLIASLAKSPPAAEPSSESGRRLAGLREVWAARAKPDLLPAHRDFRMTDLRPWFDDITIIEVTRTPMRLKPRLMGRNLVACAGVDLSRSTFESVLPARLRGALLEPFSKCIAEAAPYYAVFTVPAPHLDRHPVHLLILPCASDGRNVDILIAAAQVEGADSDGCVHRALGAYSREVRMEAFGEAMTARSEVASALTAQAVRNLTRIAGSRASASAAARDALAKHRLPKAPPSTPDSEGAIGR